ncbi:hypothetical protein ACLG6S_03655 [Thermodesulfobacteriota bacterium B35]
MRFIPADGGRRVTGEREDWFAKRRQQFMRCLVADFFRLLQGFQEMYEIYLDCCRGDRVAGCPDLLSRKTATARERIWKRLDGMVGSEAGKGPLWQLKDLCHRLWPEGAEARDLSGSLLDWLIGSVFHECMKLKENIYLLSRYAPQAIRIQDMPFSGPRPVHRLSRPGPELAGMVDIQRLLTRINADILHQIEQVGFFFGQANFMLRMMMPEMADNSLVLRLLVEEEESVAALWGETLPELFAEMFSGNPAAGFCAAGRSYLAGQWYERALAMYRRALAVDSSCDEALVKVAQLEKIIRDSSQLLAGTGQ